MTFIRTQRAPEIGFDIKSLLRRVPIAGQIGLEVEVEGNKFQKDNYVLDQMRSAWTYHHDGSLRGKDNAEYVLKSPVNFDKVPEVVAWLWQMFGDYGTKLSESNRTSVHVHLNVQDWYLNRLTVFAAMYFTFEEILTEWCGDHRVGNLFCLRGKDATGILSSLKKFIQRDGRYDLSQGLHYSAFNTNALLKFGSIELRTLRGVTEPGTIIDWVSILQRMYERSADFEDPRTLVDIFSGEGPLAYFDTIFGDVAPLIRKGITLSDDAIRDSLYEGIRHAQDLCYCRDWAKFKPMEIKKDPFGRDASKVMKAMKAASAHSIMAGSGVNQPEPSDTYEDDYDDLAVNEGPQSLQQATQALLNQVTATQMQVMAPPPAPAPNPFVAAPVNWHDIWPEPTGETY